MEEKRTKRRRTRLLRGGEVRQRGAGVHNGYDSNYDNNYHNIDDANFYIKCHYQ